MASVTEPREPDPFEPIVAFLRSIGFTVRLGPTANTALPGIAVDAGVMTVDPGAMVSAGDLLHEAGHLAVMSPARRRMASGRFDASQAEEMLADAWSYAAAVHLGIDPHVVFHAQGYGDHGGGWLVEAFANDAAIGVPGLCWLGLASHPCCAGTSGPRYPAMIAWINEAERDLR